MAKEVKWDFLSVTPVFPGARVHQLSHFLPMTTVSYSCCVPRLTHSPEWQLLFFSCLLQQTWGNGAVSEVLKFNGLRVVPNGSSFPSAYKTSRSTGCRSRMHECWQRQQMQPPLLLPCFLNLRTLPTGGTAPYNVIWCILCSKTWMIVPHPFRLSSKAEHLWSFQRPFSPINSLSGSECYHIYRISWLWGLIFTCTICTLAVN